MRKADRVPYILDFVDGDTTVSDHRHIRPRTAAERTVLLTDVMKAHRIALGLSLEAMSALCDIDADRLHLMFEVEGAQPSLDDLTLWCELTRSTIEFGTTPGVYRITHRPDNASDKLSLARKLVRDVLKHFGYFPKYNNNIASLD